MATLWDTLTPNQTEIRTSHLAALRTALTAELTRRGLGVRATYTDEADRLSGKPVRAIHIQELIDKLQNIKTAEYEDNPIIANKTVVKALHQEEIRTMINVLEIAPKVGGSSTCNAGCTGLCVSCSGTCTGGCTSCTSCSGCSGCSSCSGSCKGTCSGGCSGCSSCSGSCKGTCSGAYSGKCKAGCSTQCMGTCKYNCHSCSYWCSSGCVAQCSSCVSGCDASCWNGCDGNCTTSCFTNCESTNDARDNKKNPYT